MKTNNFYMILPSNSSPLVHPDNNASEFMVELQNPIYLDGQWEVAMMDFTFVYAAFPLYSKTKIDYLKKVDVTHNLTIIKSNKDKMISVKTNPILSISDRIHLNFASRYDFEVTFESVKIAQNFGFPLIKNKVKAGSLKTFCLSFKEDKSVELVKIDIFYTEIKSKTFQFKDDLYITDVKQLATYMGANCSEIFHLLILGEGNNFQFVPQIDVAGVKFDKLLTRTLGLEKQEYLCKGLNLEERINGISKPKIIKYHQQLFIYSSLVEPVIVGDVNVPLLKSVWLEKHEDGDVVQLIVDNPMYLPIATTCINNIEVNIRDDSGKLINFAKDSKTHLTLHFRKVTNI